MNFEKFFDTVKETAKYNSINRTIYPALGLAGETGEAVDIIKKTIRDGGIAHELGRRTEDMKYELGDVMWYWCNLVKDLDFDPYELLQMNYDKLRERYKNYVPEEKYLKGK